MPILKASLHLHTKEDPEDGKIIKYSAKDLIDQASQLDFQVLAITLHNRLYWNPELEHYAQERNIILLPGTEVSLKKNPWSQAHVLIIGAKSLPPIRTIDDLEKWRHDHPECLVIAPHPNFPVQSLGLKILPEKLNLFDAWEHSWFYTRIFNLNKPTIKLAQQFKKPLISTSDLHRHRFLKDDYCLIDCEKADQASIITAIKQGRLKNISRPKGILELVFYTLRFIRPRKGKKL